MTTIPAPQQSETHAMTDTAPTEVERANAAPENIKAARKQIMDLPWNKLDIDNVCKFVEHVDRIIVDTLATLTARAERAEAERDAAIERRDTLAAELAALRSQLAAGEDVIQLVKELAEIPTTDETPGIASSDPDLDNLIVLARKYTRAALSQGAAAEETKK